MADEFVFFEKETAALWQDNDVRRIIAETVDMLALAYDKGKRAIDRVHGKYYPMFGARAVEVSPHISLAAIQCSYTNLICDEFDRR